MNWHNAWLVLVDIFIGFWLGRLTMSPRVRESEKPFVTVAMILAAHKWANANGLPSTLTEIKGMLEAAIGEEVL